MAADETQEEQPDTGPLSPLAEPEQGDGADTPAETPLEIPTPQEPAPNPTGPTTTPDEGEQGEQDEPAAEQAQMRSEKELEKAFKAIDKLREHVANRLGTIMGEESQALVLCPMCSDLAPGFVFPPAIAPPSPEKVDSVRTFLGMHVQGTFKEHPNALLCDTCDGYGKVETPSKVPGYDIVDCPACNNTGRILTPAVPSPNGPSALTAPAPVVTGPSVFQGPPELSPELEAKRREGWVIVPPVQVTGA